MAVDLRISLHKLDVLSRVVQLGGVSRAAEDLSVALSVVTGHIRSLERHLDTVLFYRDGRQLELTEAGRLVHTWAEEVLNRSRELGRDLERLTDGTGGNIVLGASMTIGSYVLPHVLTVFRGDHPGTKIRLNISTTRHAIDDTRAGVLDFAVVAVTEHPFEAPGMHVERLGTHRITLAAAPGFGPEGGRISLAELAELPFIEPPEGTSYARLVDQQLKVAGLADRRTMLQLGHPEAMKQAAAGGLGVVPLIRTAMRAELDDGTLRELQVDGLEMSIPISLVYRKGKSFSDLHAQLIHEIRVVVAEQTDAADVAD